MLVVIVGTDGAGKTSLSRALDDGLKSSGVRSSRLDRFDILDREATPAAAFVNSDIDGLRQYALDMPAPARLLFYLWSMALTVTSKMAATDRPQVLIYDSYWIKHVAVEIQFGEDADHALSAGRLLPKPDLTIYLKAAPEDLYQRKIGDLVAYECGLDPACRKDSFITHQTHLKDRLDQWSKRDGWLEFDALQSTDALTAQIMPIVLGHLTAREREPAVRASGVKSGSI